MAMNESKWWAGMRKPKPINLMCGGDLKASDLDRFEAREREINAAYFAEQDKPVGTVDRPAIRDCGAYNGGREYSENDAVTFAGCLWIAKRQTSAIPRLDAKDDWRLAVRVGTRS